MDRYYKAIKHQAEAKDSCKWYSVQNNGCSNTCPGTYKRSRHEHTCCVHCDVRDHCPFGCSRVPQIMKQSTPSEGLILKPNPVYGVSRTTNFIKIKSTPSEDIKRFQELLQPQGTSILVCPKCYGTMYTDVANVKMCYNCKITMVPEEEVFPLSDTEMANVVLRHKNLSRTTMVVCDVGRKHCPHHGCIRLSSMQSLQTSLGSRSQVKGSNNTTSSEHHTLKGRIS